MPARIYIGKLSDSARERDVERFFRNYGRVCDIVLKNGYGFVEFEDERDADDAVYDLNGQELCGERVKLEHARGATRRTNNSAMRARPTWLDKYGAPVRTGYRLVVQNLSSRVSWQDLKDHMRQAGEVTYADAHKECKNEGVVEFATYGDMKNALVKLDGMEINGRKIKLVEDKPKSSRRRRSSSRSRSRSPSRSRSRSRRRSRKSRSRSKSPRKRRSRSSRKTKSQTPPDAKARTALKSVSRSPERMSRSPARDESRTPEKSRSRSEEGKSPRGSAPNGGDGRSRERSESHGKYRDRGLEGGRSSRSASRSPSPANDGRNDSTDED